MTVPVRVEARVEGVVQGVGFRPYAYALASRLGLTGRVGNDAGGVFLELEGDPRRVAEFFAELGQQPPPRAIVERIHTTTTVPVGSLRFEIAGSLDPATAAARPVVTADVATCDDCLRELSDLADRRHGHPFLTCTNCGPRFTIVTAVPYDREHTTMREFAMCADCAREYQDPGDRRFHAQPVCCPACGPTLTLRGPDWEPRGDADPVTMAARWLTEGAILAVKGIGGYHLAADAGSEAVVALLRERKGREQKPLAVMVPHLAAAREICEISEADADLLTSPRRPIVLLPRVDNTAVAPSVAPVQRCLGVMLPYTPLHHLLLRELPGPIVLTSGNRSGEPIAYRDDQARDRLAAIADGFLSHDRPIQVGVDDSVTRTVQGREMVLRRSRGYAPQPLRLPRPVPAPVLGCGAELKNTFCLATGDLAYPSHHIGDLTDYETLRSYTDGIDGLRRLLRIDPELVAHDLHPDYLSSKYAREVPGAELIGVQHHHAHLASCLADNGVDEPVLGVAMDGLGYGTDGTLWGGEFLALDRAEFTRLGHLEPVPLPGGDTAVRQPWRMAVSYLAYAFDGEPPEHLAVLERHPEQWPRVLRLLRAPPVAGAAPLTSSAGRLFDAVAALCGVRYQIGYEGQAAIELEQLAGPGDPDGYPVDVDTGGSGALLLRTAGLIRAVVSDLDRAVPVPMIAARFHTGLAAAVVAACQQLRRRTGLDTVALSGGVFQNLLLLRLTVEGLERAGMRVLTHQQVPPNDGGISLGQVAVAAARARV